MVQVVYLAILSRCVKATQFGVNKICGSCDDQAVVNIETGPVLSLFTRLTVLCDPVSGRCQTQ